MKKFLLLSVIFISLISCSGRKQIEKALHSGNYDQAIEVAIAKLTTNKDKQRKQEHIIMLKDAYIKAVERDLSVIDHLKKDGNDHQLKTIYDRYLTLDARQNAIRPLLPLHIGGNSVSFEFNDYSDMIIESRNSVVDFMYDEGLSLLEKDSKADIREAYEIFKYIDNLHPNYEDTAGLIREARERGTEFVRVTIENHTEQIIPKRLEENLLDFDTYGLNQFWVVYHAHENLNIIYDYAMTLQLKQIHISADELHERQLTRERQIIDGWKYQLDATGNVLKDSLGNDVKIDNVINVRARYFEFNQLKSTQLLADLVFIDLKKNEILDTFPIDSEVIFENRYATIRGDERALDAKELRYLNNPRLYFPDDTQMIYDTGEHLKLKLKDIISNYRDTI